ncbi:hypothetical protein Poli38472_011042 [Pythium oligandrum]|uniref:Proteasome activator subunit 4 n=1 Tax=Pythium oligandrum TaxID=41045 RepID=A0A8K1CRK7_PYTOL|nr:hypothetical protein Poli38472_011042 [Pythium oligandrum]|eukprot:TMW67422.1 hypothetical protein Poli38472_011042 [Pythium oligandrum]
MDDADVHTEHPYYRLLPSYITPASLASERQELVARVHETLTALEQLKDGIDGVVLQKRHFRSVETLFQLKHVLPKTLHKTLMELLVWHVWENEGKHFVDVDMQVRAVRTLTMLLRKWRSKRKPSERSEIVLSWRLVQAAVERVCFSSPGYIRPASQVTMQALASGMVKCAEAARPFFQPESGNTCVAVELWAKFGPEIRNIKSTGCFQALGTFSLLFTLSEPVETTNWSAVEALLPEFFSAWALVSRSADWDGHWFKIFSRIAKKYPEKCHVVLRTHLPYIFGKVHDLLELPSDLGSPFKNNAWPAAFSILHGTKRFDQYAMRLCAYLLEDPKVDGEPAPANQFILEILYTVKTFFHPSNASNVANVVGITIYYLIGLTAKRLGAEKASGKQLLRVESCRPIFDALLDLSYYGIYSKNRSISSKCMYVIKILVCLDPAHCARPVLDQMVRALDPQALSQSHMAPAAISSMSVFLYHLMSGRHPGGSGLLFTTYLAPLLRLTLPGIDPNDEKKTQATVTLYFHVLSWLPLVNDVAKRGNADLIKSRVDASEVYFREMEDDLFASMAPLSADVDQKMWEFGTFLEEWSLSLLDRCLEFVRTRTSAHTNSPDTSSKPAGHGPGGSRSGEDTSVLEVLNMMSLLYAQMSPAIYTQALRKTVAFVSNSFFTNAFGGKVIATLIFNCMQGNLKESLPQFMSIVVEKLRVTKTSVDVQTLMTNEKVWYLHILNGLVRFNDADHSAVLVYEAELTAILSHFLHHEDEKEVYEAATDILQHLLHALLGVYPTDFRSLPPADWELATSESAGMFQFLGTAVSWKQLNVSWHEPNQDELEFAFKLLQAHLVNTFTTLKELQASKDVNVRTWMPHLKRVFESIRGARNILVDHAVSTNSALQAGSYPLLVSAAGNNQELLNGFVGLKATIMENLHAVTTYWRTHGSKGAIENQLWHVVLKMIKQLLIWRGSHMDGHRSKEKQNAYIKATTADTASRQLQKRRRFERDLVSVTPLASRNEMVERVLFFYSKRKVQEHFELAHQALRDSNESKTKHQYEALLLDVERLMQSPYDEVRGEAGAVMRESTEIYAKWIYSRLSSLIDVLEGKVVDEASGFVKEEVISGVLEFMTKPIVLNYFWKRCGSLLARTLKALLRINEDVVKKIETEASKAKISLKAQAFFLALLASWRYVRHSASIDLIQELLATEPGQGEHWKQQLMHLVTFYPLLQPQGTPVPLGLWKLVIKQLGHEVLPVRQIALLLFAQLVGLRKWHTTSDGAVEADALLFSDATLQALFTAVLDNHRNMQRSAASADGQHANAPSDWSFGVNEVIRYLSNSSSAYPKAYPLSSVRLMNQTADSFKSTSVGTIKLIQLLTQLNPQATLSESILTRLGELVKRVDPKNSEEDRQAAFSTLGEWIGGALRGLIKLDGADEAVVAEKVTAVEGLLKKTLPHVNVVLVEPWTQLLYYVTRPSHTTSVALSRLGDIVSYVIDELEQSFARATAEDYAHQVKWLSLVEPLLLHLLPTAQTGSEEVRSIAEALRTKSLAVIEEHALAHRYKMVRDRVAKTLYVLEVNALSRDAPFPLLDKLFSLTELNTEATTDMDMEASEENPVALNAKETAMQWLSCAERIGDTRDFVTVLNKLFPVAFLTQNHAKVEIALLAKNVTNSISLSMRLYYVPEDAASATQLDAIMDVLEKFGSNPLWKTRGAVLRFLTSFTFYHWIFMSREQKQRLQTLVMTFLSDEQREVQDMAKYALRSLIHIERADVVDTLSRQLTEQAADARVKHPKLVRRLQKQEKDQESAEEIARTKQRIKTNENKMSKSILAMSAIVLAFPYSVPAFVPLLFEEMGRYLYVKLATATVSYLEKAVKDTLLEFKRTHQDNWLDIKHNLTTEQRDVFEDVLISPGYYT